MERGEVARRKALLGGAFTAMLGLSAGMTAVANASGCGDRCPELRPNERIYNPSQLLTACEEHTDLYGKADRCTFEPWSYETYTGEVEQVSGVDKNCSDTTGAHRTVGFIQSTTETNSIEVSVAVETKLSGVYSTEVKILYGHSWSYTEEKVDSLRVEIPPQGAAAVFRGAPMAEVTGRMIINFSSRRQGHFTWYVYPTLNVPAEDQPEMARLISNTRELTDEELAQCPQVPTRAGAKVESASAVAVGDLVIQEPAASTKIVMGSGDTSIRHAAE